MESTVQMKRVIRRKTDGKYFQGDSSWSDRVDRAVCFEDPLSALRAAKQQGLANVQLVLMMGEEPSSYDVVMELETA
jgi:hypothetical protein